MKKLIFISMFLAVFLPISCNKTNDNNAAPQRQENDPWLINRNDVLHLGSERDKIISLDSNSFVPLWNHTHDENEIVYAYQHNGMIRIYPEHVLGSHEITNDELDGHHYSITFCPLTESAIAWNREIDGEITEFGVSGMLLKSNLIPYDRKTGSHWSQMMGLCVNGELSGTQIETNLLVKTKFSTIKDAFPESMVINHQHCENGVCTGGLKSGDDLGDPDDSGSDLLKPGSQYFGIEKDQGVLLFNLELFADGTKLIKTNYKGRNFVIVGNRELHFFVAFRFVSNGTDFWIKAVQDALPVVMEDSDGNFYNLFGNIVNGPGKGEKLNSPTTYHANTFAWGEIFDDISVYQP